MISESMEEYLKTIYVLKKKNDNVRVTDIANKMNCTKPSVSKALYNLKTNNLVEYEAYGTIELTKEGENVARKVIEKYDIVYLFLTEVLNVDFYNAEIEAEKIKTSITDDTINKLAKYVHKVLDLTDLECDYDVNKQRCWSCARRTSKISLSGGSTKNKRVLIGMSGGVDSSVSALLLKEQGYHVIGTTMKLFNTKFNGGSDESSEVEAKEVCSKLKIPHHTLDCREEFEEYVIQDFISCYKNCKTPNPCVECNRYLKFGAMYEKAKELNCYYIATGHYAKTEYSEKYNRWVLKKSNVAKKDQSYFLWNIQKELLEHILFPLAEYESKEEIREIAKLHSLRVANKPDSEDICFIQNGNYKSFLENNSNIKPKGGNIVNSSGKVLSRHNGLYNYTIGQRKGLGISNPVPLFVVGFNEERNEVIVGEEEELYKKEVLVTSINLLLFDEIKEEIEVDVKTRYSTKTAKAKIVQEGKKIRVTFVEPQRAITPGQSAVFYIDDIVLGGGKIY